MLTLLTPTGTRPEAFALCERMMARQTYDGPVRWIIIDDGETPTPLGEVKTGWERHVVRPEPYWAVGENTQGRNLLAGLDLAEALAAEAGEDLRLAIIEDDDWYDPRWLERLAVELEAAELVGEAHAVYYNVRARRWKRYANEGHASLRCTGMRGAALVTFREVLGVPHRYYDLKLWRAFDVGVAFESRLTVGIKGMPGRPGIAAGHDGLAGAFDPDGHILRELIGDDADWYLALYEEVAMTRERYVVTKSLKYPRPTGREYKPGEEIVFEGRKARRDAEILIQAKKVTRETVAVSGVTAFVAPAPNKPVEKANSARRHQSRSKT